MPTAFGNSRIYTGPPEPSKIKRKVATDEQIGAAARLRSNGKNYGKPFDELSKIVHSADKTGKYSTTPNPYRDFTGSYDPRAQEVLNKAKR